MTDQEVTPDFGDDDPEDAWDADDPIYEKVEVMRRTVPSIEAEWHAERFQGRRSEAIRLCNSLLEEMATTPHDQDESEVRSFLQRLVAL